MAVDKDLQRIYADSEEHLVDINALKRDLECVDIIQDVYASRAVAQRLQQDDTPMRELTPEERIKFKGLVDAARHTEYMSFYDENTFEVIKRCDVPPHPNGDKRRIVTSRELCQWKIYLLKVKIRVVLRGFQDDRRKEQFRSVDSPTLRSDSLKFIFQLSADYDYDIWAWDLKAAFLQGCKYDSESECVYWNPPDDFREYFHMKPDEVAVAIKSIYGLNDAPRKWYERLAQKLCQGIIDWLKWKAKEGGFGCSRHWLDPCLFMKHSGPTPENPNTGDLPEFKDISSAGARRYPHNLKGTTCVLAAGTHVDDIIATGTKEELEALDSFLKNVFKVGALNKASSKEGLLYRGIRIRKPESCHITMDMREYEEREVIPLFDPNLPKKISQKSKDVLLNDLGQTHFRAANGKLIWVTCQVRPDLACRVSQLSSRLGKATQADHVFLNKTVLFIKENPLTIHFYRLADLNVPRLLRGTCDAAFKRKDEIDDKSRGGYFLCVGTNSSDLVGIINYHSSKIHRTCKSPTGAEAVTISGLGDQIDTTYHLFWWFYPQADPTAEILTDAYSVTSSQHKYCSDVSPNLVVDFALIRGRVRDGAIIMKHQLGKYMAADGLTKGTTEALTILQKFLHSNRLGTHGVETTKLDDKVATKLNQAYLAGKIHPNNLSIEFIDKVAMMTHLEMVGLAGVSQYTNYQFPF